MVNIGDKCNVVCEEKLYVLEEDARSALYKMEHELLQRYKSEIYTVRDLVNFPLRHCIYGNDHDSLASLAYKLRAEELGFIVM